ncbi:MAG: DUF177 domain-containing protein [Candidatus Kapabacteria bacterium]|nr:DUF177 domain-containing protein [Candidatus Kapabacteria bacterium]
MLPLTAAMITVPIQGMQDGQVLFDITVPASDIPDISSEFSRDIRVAGTVTRTGRRFAIRCTVETLAVLVCDRSLEEFDEPLCVELDLSFVVDTEGAITRSRTEQLDDEGPIPIRDDAKTIDITDEVRQELTVHLPMRRVAPRYRDKDITEIYGDMSKGDQDEAPPADDTWAALRGIQQRDN